ncbi:MAG TPA: hypothetical protein VFX12_03735 [Vicinamibacterales bacterium]|nr:hypothetical protein [Vicinamibacterales bacterium]
MRPWLCAALLAAVVAAAAAPAFADATDQLASARRLYNQGRYDDALSAAREVVANPALASSARLIVGRARLERFRRNADPADLEAARGALRALDPRALDARERVELTVGLSELLYLDDHFGAAAEMLEPALDATRVLGEAAHDRALDWWATALDREAQTQPPPERVSAYTRILDRMARVLERDPGSEPANYWMAAAARGAGDPDRAWQAAAAGWLRAPLARDRGAALRADLDRLVAQGILPDRAARLSVRDPRQALAGMLNEWQAFKESWR